MGSRKVFLAWEVGAGRGHISNLASLMTGLRSHGFTGYAGLCSIDFANELEGLVDHVVHVKTLPYFNHLRAENRKGPAATYGEFLGDLGYFSAHIIAKHVECWREAIAAARPDVVVADQGPSALIAARSLGIPAVAVGNSYTLPPSDLPSYPILLPEYAERIWDERSMCNAVNEVLDTYSLPHLTALPEIYKVDLELPRAIKLLDPYSDQRRGEVISPHVPGAVRRAFTTSRSEVFAYLSSSDQRDVHLLATLLSLPVPVRCFLPNGNPQTLALLRDHGVLVEAAPLTPKQISRRSRVFINAGNFGSVCMGIRAAIPQFMIPQQLEQMLVARRLAETGAGKVIGFHDRTSNAYHDAIMELFESNDAAQRAHDVAEATEPEFRIDGEALAAARITALLST